MPSSLVSLAPEILCNIIKELSIKDSRNLLRSCTKLYNNGKYAFDKKSFRVIPVGLTEEGIDLAKQLLNNQSFYFIQEIFIRFQSGLYGFGYERLHIENTLISIITQGLQASTEPLIITIYDHPKIFNDPLGACMKTVARAISAIISIKPARPFTVQVQNLRLDNCEELFRYGQPFLDRVKSLELRFDGFNTGRRALNGIKKVLPLISNLEELSLSNDSELSYLTPETFQQIMKKINPKSLKRLNIIGLNITASEFHQALSPFQDYLKGLKLENIVFEEGSLDEFVDYIVNSLAVVLDSFSARNIWEVDRLEISQYLDPMVLFRQAGMTVWGFDIIANLVS